MPLKRSQIQAAISEAIDTFSRFRLHLPEWAFWTPDQWEQAGLECDEIRHCMLGWDATDFGSGDFDRIGRTLFTLRNGTTRHPGYPKVYSQKYLFDPEGQRAPAHFHLKKMEDLCCLAGGNILVQLRAVNPDNTPSEKSLKVRVDGIMLDLPAGEVVRLHPGQSLCIPPRIIHQFWGEEGTGITISSEVSSVCDDWSDNFFLDPAERFPEIIEDEPRRHYLCHEYPDTVLSK